jgi:hypothetical protein
MNAVIAGLIMAGLQRGSTFQRKIRRLRTHAVPFAVAVSILAGLSWVSGELAIGVLGSFAAVWLTAIYWSLYRAAGSR